MGTPGRRDAAYQTTKERGGLEIIISNASDRPIYEQIANQIRDAILAGRLAEGDGLPSIRSLANDLRVSVITTKRAYAELEALGFVDTVPGKGCFVAGGNLELLREEQLRGVESLLEQAWRDSRAANISLPELHEMLDTIAE